ncbi:alpha/beta hydrolase [Haliangium ochraceum]|uniref:AB hydrolase-1 domain-containing protein n=1 Tax=Haliangium ochraceum (strain DSM 14365 / JCM 11303 / SMP-2) TaxID=502025 RepID=D0LJJ3_HALO1|nr:alpha/beta fold hydrolase [Haliangium ochraceum]ACY16567.1 hypothetical protein Hoch_4068 [Haliangium ochraceum DSM 14365]
MTRRARTALLVAAVVAGLLALAYLAIAYAFSSEVVAFSTRTLAEDQAELDIDSVSDFGLPPPRELRIDTGELSLAGWLFTHGGKARCGAVFSHGYRGTRFATLKYVRLLWQRGCDVLSFDARNHGDSDRALSSFGYHERRDLVAVVRWLSAERDLPLERIGLVGESMGAAISLQAAALLPELGFVIADSSFASLEAILRRQATARYGSVVHLFVPAALAIAELRADAALSEVDAAQAAAATRAPILIMHSLADEYTPWTHAQAIHDAVPHERKVLHLLDWGAAHGQSVELRFDAYDRLVGEFLDTFVPGL